MKELLLLITLTILPLSEALAVNAESKGLAIAQEMDRRNSGWNDQTADMQMVLRNGRGDESHREIRARTLEVQGDGDKSLHIFDGPADVRGTAFLSFTHATDPDDQWLYLPALKRIKRISSANKSGPFMGSEFAYEDISSQELEKYSYKWLRDELLDGHETMVVERHPSYEHSGYTKQEMWVDKNMYEPLKIEYYDRKGAQLKTVTFHDYQQYLGQYWRPERMEMVNHQTGKSTTLEITNYRFRTGLTASDFNRNSLKRIR
ncbi:membrane protein [Marinobacterium nitratireducens]|uniref:Membrane protein n=1 Tax=Marinobacterium nitratireducens TaxID=518897 RepID=A0A917ZHH8_9GAMM|nr:outer membrane lipoprotein-sorting protein [Marinobacterium nitratireducens]GGO83343.1 membrane protein [Marinobacterium nitratireducens]